MISKEDLIAKKIKLLADYKTHLFIEQYADKNISNMIMYIKEMFSTLPRIIPSSTQLYSTNVSIKRETCAKNIFTSIIYSERYKSYLNDKIFETPKFINASIETLEKLMHYGEIIWSKQLVIELKKIRTKRFPGVEFPNSVYQLFRKNIRL
jgi:hypothetical protein